MANLFISFPGTSPYLDCIYFMNNKESACVKFVQEAIINILCESWGKEDRFIFFTTKEAYNKNWLDNGQGDAPVTGLENRIKSLGLPCVIENVMIPEAKTEKEIWDIFQIIIDKIDFKDEIYLDITHAFRSIPTLAVVVLNYLKIVKSVEIKAIYYGAFEVLGSPIEASKKPVNERRAPVLDLTALDSLLDWSFAVSRFVNSGDAFLINKLSQKAVKPLLKSSKGSDAEASAFRNLGNKMEEFTKGFATCRGPEITQLSKGLKKAIDECRGFDLIKPFGPLMNIIEKELEKFSGDEIRQGIRAAEWCLNHNLIQQGYTILNETLISYFADSLNMNPADRNDRELVSGGVNVISKDKPYEKWDAGLKNNPEMMLKIKALAKRDATLIKVFQACSQKRNNLNHAGYPNEKLSSAKLTAELYELINKTIDYMNI
jgi:CRISPR-associated Csx2 family protein